MSKSVPFLGLIFVLALFSGSAQPQGTTFTYTAIDVPFAGASNTRANSINARGDIVGRYEDSGGAHGFLLSQGLFTTIIIPDADAKNDDDGPARGINARGDLVGHYFDTTGGRACLPLEWRFCHYD